MELALPILALGSLYIVFNKNKKNDDIIMVPTNKSSSVKENFQNNIGKQSNYLPNEKPEIINYPTTNENELKSDVNYYSNPNTATDKYFNQTLYENNVNKNIPVGQNIQNVYSLSGDYLNSGEFKHNNMKPFYGAKIKGQNYNNNNAESVLDNLIGSGSQNIKKIEQAPLFKPQQNVQYSHGTPNHSDFYQSRVVPGIKNNSVKPFESVQVGPGLGKEYNTQGSNGFNSGMELRELWMDKTVDELRIKTNPKEEYNLYGLEGPAQSKIQQMGSIGKVEKYTPDGFFINDQSRWLTTTGAEKSGQLIPQFIVNESNRNNTSSSYQGVASSAHKNGSYQNGVYETTKRNELSGQDVPISTASGRGPLVQQNRLSSYDNANNNRSCNPQPESFGSSFNSAIGAITAPIMDILRPTKKQEICNGVTVYGDAGTSVSNNYVINLGDTPKITNKETTLYSPHGNIGNQSDGQQYVNSCRPINNQRDTTSCPDNWGGIGGISNQYGNIDEEAYRNQTNNDKKQTMSWANQGNMNLFNDNTNYNLSRKDNSDTSRVQAPKNIVSMPPNLETYGKIHMPQYYNECIGTDRISPDLLNAFRNNPYTHTLTDSA